MVNQTDSACAAYRGGLEQHLSQHDAQISALFKGMGELQKAFAYRVPPWATIVIGLLAGAVGWFSKGGP